MKKRGVGERARGKSGGSREGKANTPKKLLTKGGKQGSTKQRKTDKEYSGRRDEGGEGQGRY